MLKGNFMDSASAYLLHSTSREQWCFGSKRALTMEWTTVFLENHTGRACPTHTHVSGELLELINFQFPMSSLMLDATQAVDAFGTGRCGRVNLLYGIFTGFLHSSPPVPRVRLGPKVCGLWGLIYYTTVVFSTPATHHQNRNQHDPLI